MFSILCQAEAAGAAATQAAGAASDAAATPVFEWGSILMIVGIFAVFYFFMIRPQQKRQKEIQKMREKLDKGSKIVTAGGIMGTVKDVQANYFLVEIASGVTIRVDKNSVYANTEDANAAQEEKK